MTNVSCELNKIVFLCGTFFINLYQNKYMLWETQY